MKRFKFSLFGMMATIALLAFAIAIYRIPWLALRTSAFFAAVVLTLLTATLGSLLNRRASWIGFSLFGWTWLIVSFLALEVGSKHSSEDTVPVPMPITAMWLVEFSSSVLGFNTFVEGEPVTTIPNSKGGFSLMSHSLVQVCNLLHSLLAACFGALLATWFARREPHGGTGRSERAADEENRN